MARESNRDERRDQIAEAAWRVIERRGLDSVGMRDIAAEAGCTTGSLTHHFDGKRDLMAHAFGLLIERIMARVQASARDQGLFEALCEVLPLDRRRRREAAVWLTLVTASIREPLLARELRQRQRTGIAKGMSIVRDGTRGEVDLSETADELMAIVDGITVDALSDPDRYPPQRQIALLRRALDRMDGK